MLFLWDYVLAGLVFVFFALLTWLLLWPHGESWIPEELQDTASYPGRVRR